MDEIVKQLRQEIRAGLRVRLRKVKVDSGSGKSFKTQHPAIWSSSRRMTKAEHKDSEDSDVRMTKKGKKFRPFQRHEVGRIQRRRHSHHPCTQT